MPLPLPWSVGKTALTERTAHEKGGCFPKETPPRVSRYFFVGRNLPPFGRSADRYLRRRSFRRSAFAC